MREVLIWALQISPISKNTLKYLSTVTKPQNKYGGANVSGHTHI